LDAEPIEAEIDRCVWWGCLSGVLAAVAGAIGGWTVAAKPVEAGASAKFLGLIGTLIGAIVAAPLGLLIGSTLAWLLPLFALFVLVALFPVRELLRKWLPNRTPIGSFVASPNPVTAATA
jgi:hypothetical protein